MSKIKLFLTFILFFIFGFSIISKTYTQDNFYIKYFQTEEFNFNKNNNLIITSSNFSEYQDRLLIYKKIFIICNSKDFKYKDLVICDNQNVVSLDKNFLVTKIEKSNNVFASLKITDSNTIIFFIPEINFSKPANIEILSSYLKAVKNSDLFLIPETLKFSGIKKIILNTTYTWVFELFYLCLIGIILVAITYQLIKVYEKPFKDLYLIVLEFVKDNWVMMFFFVLIIMLFCIVAEDYLISEKKYTFEKSLFLQLVNPYNIHSTFNSSDPRSLYLFVLFHTFIFMLIIWITPYFSLLVKDSVLSIKNLKLKPRLLSFLYLVNIFILILMLNFNISNLLLYLILNFIILITLELFIIQRKVHLDESFNKIEKTLILTLVGIFVILNTFCNTNKCEIFLNKFFRYENLVDSSEKISMTPYIKKTSENTLVSNFSINSDSPIFIDNYLLSYNKFSIINNKPISEFNPYKSFFIVSEDLKNLSNFIFSNKASFKTINSDKTTRFFYLTKNSKSNIQDLKLEVIYYCNYAKFKNFLKINQEKLLSLNPCNKKETSINSISIDIDRNLFDFKEGTVYEITNFEFIKSIKIVSSDGIEIFKINFINLDKLNNYYVIYVNNSSLEIDNYLFNESSNIDLDLNSFNNKSEFINYLKLNKKIKNEFLIWSPESYTIINNDYKKN